MRIRAVLPIALLATDAALAVDPSTLPKVSCSDFQYSEAFLQKFPKAPAGCIEGRLYNGEKWAKFNAKVYLVNLPDFITIEVLDAAGNPLETLSFKPAAGAKAVVDGKSISVKEVKAGNVVTFWKSEKTMDTKAMPADTAESWTLLPPQKSQ